MNAQQTTTVEAIVNVFETGSVQSGYGRMAILKGDKGHLSYGRSQASLGSGNLFALLDDYCGQTTSMFGDVLRPSLPRFKQCDVTLDTDQQVKATLKQAGDDPVMRDVQDRFFRARFLSPALTAAQQIGVTQPLGGAVVYDSFIQGGWSRVQPALGKVGSTGEQDWVDKYVAARRRWLLSLAPPLPTTVYRMDSFSQLIASGNWFLQLPIVVHGVTIAPDDLAPLPGSAPHAGPRTLRLTTPYMRGADVAALQKALGIPVDGIHGPFTDLMLSDWKKAQQPPITEPGAGVQTRAVLKF